MTASASLPAPLVVVMGASGCGKSSVGAALAARLGVPFQDADDLHPASNIAKMSSGIPLTDDDRAPWLRIVGDELHRQERTGLVIACSALRQIYRDVIREHAAEVFFVHLDVKKEVLAARLFMRSEHFMPLDLLESQLATLEPLDPEEPGFTIDATQKIHTIVSRAEDVVRERGRARSAASLI